MRKPRNTEIKKFELRSYSWYVVMPSYKLQTLQLCLFPKLTTLLPLLHMGLVND